MRRIPALFIFLFATLIFFLSFTVFTHAQTSSDDAQQSQRWVCLEASNCVTNSANCSAAAQSDAADPQVRRVRLTPKKDLKPLPSADTFVVECVASATQQVCTTGSADADMRLYGVNNTTRLGGYHFTGMFEQNGTTRVTQPVKSNAAGDVGPYEWSSNATSARRFLAVNLFDAQKKADGQSTSQQQGTITFETAVSGCTTISWDPYGRVFDADTLEPIRGASVQLFFKNKAGEFQFMTNNDLNGAGSITNPYLTKTDGRFAFVVPDNTYRLSASVGGYTYPVKTVGELFSEYTKIYSDIYPAQKGEDIVQKGEIQHRDIPLQSMNGQHQNNPIELTDLFTDLDKTSESYIVQGRVSHPLTKISVWTKRVLADGQVEKKFRKVTTFDADKSGKFRQAISQKGFQPNEVIDQLELVKNLPVKKKTDLGSSIASAVAPQVRAQEEDVLVTLPVIPNFLEGTVTDVNGKIIPRATVQITLSFSNKPYYTTQADKNGYYKVTSEHLPFMPYKVVYISPSGGVRTLAPELVLAQNVRLMMSDGTNPNLYKDEKGQNATLALANMKNQSGNTDQNGYTNSMQNTNVSPTVAVTSSEQAFVTAVVVVLLLVVLAVILLLFIKNPRKMPDLNP